MSVEIDIPALTDQLISGDRFALSRCITFAESTLAAHQSISQKILADIPPNDGRSLRIAISGSPGVGKSTFIEKFGLFLIALGKKVAVLAIDPSSSISKGSILGDKTRMQELSRQPQAFVRPSPAGKALGGVADRTKESMHLCEAAGYDIILIETVGVGQSEYFAANLVDFFLLLILPGAGDALQGIKRGIVEIADLIVIHKADGTRIDLANQTYRQYKQALHLFALKEIGWAAPVVKASSEEVTGLDHIWEVIQSFTNQIGLQRRLTKRADQDQTWLDQKIRDWIIERYFKHDDHQKSIEHIILKIKGQKISVYKGLEEVKELMANG